MRKILLLGLIFYSVFVNAQFTYQLNQEITVTGPESTTLSMPWGGGLNAAQYNTLDINNDNQDDLILFDRTANKVITYLAIDNNYQYAPEYEHLFPEMNNWILLRDFNCDGKKDLFTGNVLGVKVFINKTPDNGILEWEQFLFFIQPGQPKSEVLLTKGFSGKINLQLQFDDLPNITDMDGDGDLDILCPQFGSGSTLEFHQNFSMERYGACDSLDFERITQTWGDIKECTCGNFAFNGADCPGGSGGRVDHSGGKALLTIDIDNDLDQDLLFSEADCPNLFLLINEGNDVTPVFSSSSNFPTPNPVDLNFFPAPFYEDVDFDNKKDIIISPNLFNKAYLQIDYQHSNWFYKNEGTTSLPNLIFMEKNFLQKEMIDVGDHAVPAFADMDHDGDLDLFLGQQTGENVFASITLYENTGTSTEPAFEFVTDDYLTISNLFLYNLKPQFYDADSDGKLDLVITATSNTTSLTKLYVLFNKSSTTLDFSGQTFTEINLNVLYSENVHMMDVDLDGLADVLLSKSNGTISYYHNNGPQGSISLSLANSTFLNLGPSIDLQSVSITSGDLNSDGKGDLVLGDIYGKIGIIDNFRETVQGTLITDVIWDPLTETFESRNLGGRVWATVGNLFDDNKPALIVGNLLGGVQTLRYEQVIVGTDENIIETSIKIFPNPISIGQPLYIKTGKPAVLQIISLYGQTLTDSVKIEANQTFPINIAPQSPGVYLLRFSIDNKTFTKKLIVKG